MKEKLDDIYFAQFGEYYEWSYCPETGMWYEDAKEILPEPPGELEKESDFSCITVVGQDYEQEVMDHNYDVIIAFLNYLEDKDDFSDCIGFQLFLRSEKYSLVGDFSNRLVYRLSEFISDIKTKDYANCYENEYSNYKFFVWKKPDRQVRFSIYCYNECDYDGRYLKLIFDILVDEAVLISKLESIITTFKETVYDAIQSYNKYMGNDFRIRRSDYVFENLFPEYVEIEDPD